jgi:biopolymer transport protein TolR
MAIGSNTDQMMSDINVTPFVDVMLVLLIIFMVTAPMMTQGVDVTLPQATSEPLPTQEEQLMVTIDKDKTIYINEQPVIFASLGEKVNRLVAGRPDRPVYLRADESVTYGEVIRVMSQIKDAGVAHVGMVTVPLSTADEKDELK